MMTFQFSSAVFIGMVLAILLLNVAQWAIYQDRSYGYYTGYMLAWLVYFGLRVTAFSDWYPPAVSQLVRTTAAMGAFYVYVDFADAILDLRRRRPRLYRKLQYVQAGLVAYVLLQVVLCFLLPEQPAIRENAYTLMRLVMAVVALYSIRQIVLLGGLVAWAYAVGTVFLLAGSLTAMTMAMRHPAENWAGSPWSVSLTYMQVGIMAELVCFSLGLSYRQRRAAIRTAVMAQEMQHERERHHRDQLEAELALQRLQQEKTEVQIRGLQAQVNPHFLFNSLNSLSALIEDDTRRAGLFLDELSSVYRYLLRANDRILTSLGAEMAFIQSYYHLLQTRHGNALQVEWRVPPGLLTRQLPPLTLQLLVENAVKHNIALSERPLHICIGSDGQGRLQVRNNIQRKTVRVATNGVGLSNILSKYQMLGQPAPVICETQGQFVVTLALIDA